MRATMSRSWKGAREGSVARVTRYCAECGVPLGTFRHHEGPGYCCSGCPRGACTCETLYVSCDRAEERIRGAYRLS